MIEIRDETPSDYPAIRALLLGSFDGPTEAELVDRLRADGDAVIALVAVIDGAIAGHAIYSRMDGPFKALGLGPIAVDAQARGKGVATRLIKEGIDRARRQGWMGMFVLGEPDFYGRFGFLAEHAAGFQSIYAGPNLMALPLTAIGFPVKAGRMDYAPAFAAFG